MKTNLFLTFFFVWMAGILVAQNIENGAGKMTVMELERQIVESWPEDQRKIVAGIVREGPAELIAVCFANPRTTLFTFDGIKAQPEGISKYQNTITLLRTDAGAFWPNEGPASAVTGGMGVAKLRGNDYLLVEPFISTASSLIPSVQLTPEMLATKVERLKLADKMEAALKSKLDTHTAPQPVGAELPKQTTLLKTSATAPAKQEAPITSAAAQTVGAESDHTSYWLAGVLAALALFAWRRRVRGVKNE